MEWEEVHHRLLDSLHAEMRKKWGRIAEIEKRLECSEGYLSRLCSGRNEFRLDFFIKSVAALGLDHRSFFARALDIYPRTEDYLKQLEAADEQDRALSRMVRATLELESSEPEPPSGPVVGASLVAAIANRPLREQLRRLRHSARYRGCAFTRAYLDHLDSLRVDNAVEAGKLAVAVAVDLIPALPGPQAERLSLQCLALGIFGSARRQKAEFTAAARAFRLGLEISHRHGLRRDAANLLLRSSYLLKDFGHFERAIALLKEALVIFVQVGSPRDLGRALVDHGMMSCYAGDYESAVLDLQQALRHLEGSEEELRRYHMAAYQFLAYACEQLGDLDAAEDCLAEATRRTRHEADLAKMQWLRGSLALRRREYRKSEELLRAAAEALASRENPVQEALACLDLVSALLGQDKNAEAVELASGMASLLMKLKNNLLAGAAVVELINAALVGGLNEKIVAEVRARLRQGSTPQPGVPRRK